MYQYVCTTSWRAWRTNAVGLRMRMSCSDRGSSRWRSPSKHCTTSWRGPKRWAKRCGRCFDMWSAGHQSARTIVGSNHPRDVTHANSRRCEKVCPVWLWSLFEGRGSLQGNPLVKKSLCWQTLRSALEMVETRKPLKFLLSLFQAPSVWKFRLTHKSLEDSEQASHVVQPHFILSSSFHISQLHYVWGIVEGGWQKRFKIKMRRVNFNILV